MSGKLRSLAALLTSTGINAAVAATPDPANPPVIPAASAEITDDTPVVLEADAISLAAAARAQGIAEGKAAERARTSAVLSSDAARANIGGAAFLLSKTDAAAEDIVKELPQLGSAAPAPAAAAPAAAAPALSVDLSETPKPNLGAPAGAANEGEADNKVDTDKMWADVRAGRLESESPLTAGGIRVPGANN
jgi:hypothetical protein